LWDIRRDGHYQKLPSPRAPRPYEIELVEVFHSETINLDLNERVLAPSTHPAKTECHVDDARNHEPHVSLPAWKKS